MAKEIKIVQVAFNILDPDQRALCEYVQLRPNQSGYIKRLIQRDIDNGFTVQSDPYPVQMDRKVEQMGNTVDFSLNGFI